MNVDYHVCPLAGVEYSSQNIDSPCFDNHNVTQLKPGTDYPTSEEYFNYISTFNYETFNYIDYMEFTGYYPISTIEVYSNEYTKDEALQLEGDLKQFYNEDYMYINVLIIDDAYDDTIYYTDSEGDKEETFEEYNPQYYKLPEDYKPDKT